MFTTVVVSLSVMTSVFVLNLHFRSPTTHQLPYWIRHVFLETLPKFLLMKRPRKGMDLEEEVDFDWAHSDLANYDNPYRGRTKFQPIHNDDSDSDLYPNISYSSTFVGIDTSNIDMPAICEVRLFHCRL